MPQQGKSAVNFDKFLSKTLSWLLRHGAQKQGIAIRSDGYVDLHVVVTSQPLAGKCTVEDIERVVQHNDKQRFTIRRCPETNVLQIRANQGHSIHAVTNLALTPIIDILPENVIHGTYNKYWKRIQTSGLCRMNRLHIHFASGLPKDSSVKSGIRKNCEILIYINLQQALADGLKFFKSSNDVILTPGNDQGILAPKYFKRVINAKSGAIIQ